MSNADDLVGNPARDNSRYCLAQPGEVYLVYLPDGGRVTLDLSEAAGDLDVSWFDPRSGGPLMPAASVRGGAPAALVAPSADDWLALVRSRPLGSSATRFRSLPVGPAAAGEVGTGEEPLRIVGTTLGDASRPDGGIPPVGEDSKYKDVSVDADTDRPVDASVYYVDDVSVR